MIASVLAAAVAAFAVVALTTGGGGEETARQSEGQAVFVRMGCGSCHTLAAAGSSGPIGPNLDTRLEDHTRESLEAKILSPGPTSAMPPDFGRRMSDAELDALVEFLLSVR